MIWQRIKYNLELMWEQKLILLVVTNICVSGYLGNKILNLKVDEKLTRLVIDHNTKEDLLYMKETACKRGLKSVLLKDADPKFVSPILIKELKNDDYRNFEVENTDRIAISMRSDVVCTALLKYNDSEMRAFDIDIAEDRENAAILYMVQDINEKLYLGDV